MPEAPEVETVRRTLTPHIVGKTLAEPWFSGLGLRNHIPDPREFSFLVGQPIEATSRHGKVLFIHAHTGGLIVRLGMSGRLLVEDARAGLAPHTHLRWGLRPGRTELRYVDPRRFGDVRPYVDDDVRRALIGSLGPDPTTLEDKSVRAAVGAALGRTKRAIKAALLDQALVAGLGNIYVCEALFIARLSPFRRASSLNRAERDRLLLACHRVIADGIERRGTTLNDYVDADGAAGDNQNHLLVFAREGERCTVCQGPIKRRTQQNRSTYYCPTCQHAR